MLYNLEQLQDTLIAYGFGRYRTYDNLRKYFHCERGAVGLGFKGKFHLYCFEKSDFIYFEAFFKDSNVEVYESNYPGAYNEKPQ